MNINICNEELDINDTDTLMFVVEVHCRMPADWENDYSYDEDSIKYIKEKLIRTLNDKGCCFIQRNESRQIIGFHWLSIENNQEKKCRIGIIHSLWVNPAYRNQGIATRLKAIGEKWLISENARSVRTNVSVKNDVMLALNQSQGFEVKYIAMEKILSKENE